VADHQLWRLAPCLFIQLLNMNRLGVNLLLLGEGGRHGHHGQRLIDLRRLANSFQLAPTRIHSLRRLSLSIHITMHLNLLDEDLLAISPQLRLHAAGLPAKSWAQLVCLFLHHLLCTLLTHLRQLHILLLRLARWDFGCVLADVADELEVLLLLRRRLADDQSH